MGILKLMAQTNRKMTSISSTKVQECRNKRFITVKFRSSKRECNKTLERMIEIGYLGILPQANGKSIFLNVRKKYSGQHYGGKLFGNVLLIEWDFHTVNF